MAGHDCLGLTDERRFEVPITLIRPEYSVEQARAWIDDGQLPELAAARDVTFVDIDSGHWPMLSCPVAFAQVLDAAATSS